jgi:hypothetical protein
MAGGSPNVPTATGRSPGRAMNCSAARIIIGRSLRALPPVSIITTTG